MAKVDVHIARRAGGKDHIVRTLDTTPAERATCRYMMEAAQAFLDDPANMGDLAGQCKVDYVVPEHVWDEMMVQAVAHHGGLPLGNFAPGQQFDPVHDVMKSNFGRKVLDGLGLKGSVEFL